MLHTVGALAVRSMDTIEWVVVGLINLGLLAVWVSRPETGRKQLP